MTGNSPALQPNYYPQISTLYKYIVHQTDLTFGLSTPIPKLMVAAMTGNSPAIQPLWTSSRLSFFSPAWYAWVGTPFLVRWEATSPQPSRVLQYTIPHPNSDCNKSRHNSNIFICHVSLFMCGETNLEFYYDFPFVIIILFCYVPYHAYIRNYWHDSMMTFILCLYHLGN